MSRLRWLLAVLVPLALIAGCSAPAVAPASADCAPSGPAPTSDVKFRHATNVTIRGAAGYRLLTVEHPFPGGAPQSIVLAGCGGPDPLLPPELTGTPVVHTPVTGIFAESTTQLPSISELGLLDRLTGVGALNLVTDPAVRERAKSARLPQFAPNQEIDGEQVTAAAPPVVLSAGSDDPAFPTLRAAGIPVVGWADYLEDGPLGQAEWIKVMGALTGKDAEAATAFDGIEQRYSALAAKARGARPTPFVAGQPYQGTWNVAAAESTAGQRYHDAAGVWSGLQIAGTGTVQRPLESVLAQDGDARIWIADGPFRTLADIAALDPRLATIAAARPGGQVWTPDGANTPEGGNPMFERGVLHPDEVLGDLVAILHPDLMPGHKFLYYRRVPAR